jgi:hypothetical protein
VNNYAEKGRTKGERKKERKKAIFGEEQIINVLTMKLYPFSCPHLDPNIFLSTPFSNTLSICTSFNVKDQVSHPYKTRMLFKPRFINIGYAVQ